MAAGFGNLCAEVAQHLKGLRCPSKAVSSATRRAEATKSQGPLVGRATQASTIEMAGHCEGLRDGGFGSELGLEPNERLLWDWLVLRWPLAQPGTVGRSVPSKMAEQQLVPFAEQGKARA